MMKWHFSVPSLFLSFSVERAREESEYQRKKSSSQTKVFLALQRAMYQKVELRQLIEYNGHVTRHLPNYYFSYFLELHAAVSQVSLAELWARSLARWRLAQVLMATPNEPDMPSKRTKKVRLGIKRSTQIRPN